MRVYLILLILLYPFDLRADLLDFPDDEVDTPVEDPKKEDDNPSEPPLMDDDGKKETRPKDVIKPKTTTPTNKKPTKKKDSPKKNTKRSPIEFTSDGARVTKEKGVFELKDNVRVKQDDFKLKANNAKAYMNKDTDEVEKIVATGDIEMFKIDAETGEKIKAYGDKVTFEGDKQIVILEGNARLFKGKDIIKSDKITYDMETGWITSKKVKGVIKSAASNDDGDK